MAFAMTCAGPFGVEAGDKLSGFLRLCNWFLAWCIAFGLRDLVNDFGFMRHTCTPCPALDYRAHLNAEAYCFGSQAHSDSKDADLFTHTCTLNSPCTLI